MFRVKTSQADKSLNKALFSTPCFSVRSFDAEKQGVLNFNCQMSGLFIAIKKVIVASVVLPTLFVGCQRPTKNDVAFPIPTRQVTDDLGRTITVPVKITRVVSTAPSVTENIFAVGAGDRLVGVTTFCNYPEDAKLIPKIGDTMTPNMETIIALRPDVVFASTASQIETFTKTLEQNGIAVYVTNPTDITGVFNNFRNLAQLLDTWPGSAGVLGKLELRADRVYGAVHPGRDVPVFVQFSKEPLFTMGKESFLNQVLEVAGGRSVNAHVETAYPKLSKETALALQPDAIILSDSPDNQEPNEAFRNSPAVKNDRVYKVNADLLSRPGPRLVDALEQIARHLHPDKFGQTEK